MCYCHTFYFFIGCFWNTILQSKLYHEGLLKEEIENKLQSLKYELTQHELNSTFKVFVSQEKNRTNVYLSLNGESLYKRNYKKSFYAKAPIKEHLGAALFNLWKPKANLGSDDLIYIPFAGSGTLGFEAILNLYNLRPMLWRDEFSMKEITGYPQASQKYLQKTADSELSNVEANFAKVEFLDSDEKTIEELEKNIACFSNVSTKLHFDAVKGDFFTYTPNEMAGKNVVVGLNPPYGIRLNAGENKVEFYKQIAEKLNDLSSKSKSFSGFCLLPDEKSSFVFIEALKGFDTKLRHLTQGGKHIRVAVFESQ